jgi:hypothetical protein
MPLLTTRGASSARGFGFGKGPLAFRVLLVAGGTGGTSGHSPGGQGGGFTDSSGNALAKGTYTVTVGAGGAGGAAGTPSGTFGGNSQASSFSGTGVSLTGAAVTQATGAGANGVNPK